MNRSRLIVILLTGALVLGACTGSTETDIAIVEEVVAQPTTITNTEVPPTPEPTPTEEPESVMLPVSMVSAPLGEGDFNQYLEIGRAHV